jgi:hypothetical protein
MVFDRDGRFLRAVGRIGEGPEEFRGAISGMAVGDSIVVFDPMNLRATVIGPDFRVVRMLRMPFPIRNAVPTNWPREVIASAGVRSREALGWPLHRLSFESGDVVAEAHFGPGDGTRNLDVPPGMITFILSTARGGGAWAADAAEYILTRWTARGQQTAALSRKPSWFPNSTAGLFARPVRPPPSRLGGILEDADSGFVWVLGQVAAPDWKEAWPAGAGSASEVSVRSVAIEKLHDTRIELLDPRSRRVVAEGFLDGPVLNTLPDNRVAMYVVDDDGFPFIRIVALRIRWP